VIKAGATKTLFGFISGRGTQHGKLTNRKKVRVRQDNPANKARHMKNLDKQFDKDTTRLYQSALKDIKGNIVWDQFKR
jgi:hypothetical protein